MKNLSLSVIIPTYNRKDILKKCLNALFNQTYPQSNYEIIVIDDGSTDGTEEVVRGSIRSSSITIYYFKQRNKGPAVARNLGIKKAKGEIIFLTGDDIIATPTLLAEHIIWHTERFQQDNIAILGYVTWAPEIKITPFMHWLENGGPQFCYYKLQNGGEVEWKYLWTPNVSFKREFLIGNKLFFDERFPSAAYEDVEFGYRLAKRGLRIFYNRDAVAYHYHHTTIEDAEKRMFRVGKSLKILHNIHPQLLEIIHQPSSPTLYAKIKYFFLSNIFKKVHKNAYYMVKLNRQFVQGYFS